MKRQLRNKSKKIICLCLFSSGILFYGNAWSQTTRQDSTKKAKEDSTLKAAAGVAAYDKPPALVPVAFGQQSERQLVGAISYLSGNKLERSSVTLLSNAFAGQMAGLYSEQTNGAPRYDNPALTLRGKTPLIVIDGVPQYNLVSLTAANIVSGTTNQVLFDVLSINPEQVESIVLLKDALSTAMYGNQGMNGVLMVTTRRGAEGKGSYLAFTGDAGIQTPIGMRKALSAYDYASLYNEAAANSGLSPFYSSAQLAGYQNRTDPYAYPNVNWQDAVLKKNALVQHYNLSGAGTYANLRYFLSLDYQAQGGLLKEDAATPYGTNVDYRRYIIRTNIDMNLDKHLSASINLIGNIQDYYQPGVGFGAVFAGIQNTPALATPIYNFTGNSFGGTKQFPNNPYAAATATGYLKNNLQAVSAKIAVKRTMDDLVKGMYVKASIAYTPTYEQEIDRSKNYNAYYYPVTGDTTQRLRVSTVSEQANGSATIERFQQTYAEVSTGIDRTWDKNTFNAILLGRYDNTHGDNNLNQVTKGFSARINYTYNNRYNFEVAGAYNGNNYFAPGNKFGFYPSAGVSWNIDQEDFFKDVTTFNRVKLRATYGLVGNANPGYFVYQQNYKSGTAYIFGTGATSTASVLQDVLANPNRVAEKANKLDIGLDLAYSQQRGWLNIDYFNNMEYDLLQFPTNNTAILGQTYPLENIGKDRYYGFELNTGWADKIGGLHYAISANLSTVGGTVIYNAQQPVPYSYLVTAGGPINAIRGYVADGFFNSGNLVAATMPGFKPSPGDVKYQDLNNDGVINQYDQTIIGNKKSLVFYGGSLSLQYKGLDLTVLIQGVTNRDILVNGNYEFPFSGDYGNAYEYNLNRWTPQTAATAKLPRVTLGTDVNNYISSSLFVRNGNYVRLKNAELGYNISGYLLSKAKIKGIRIFVKGENLITWSKYKESDPEDYTGLYPIQRVLNAGLSVKL